MERLTALETQAREKKLGVLSAGESRVINQNFTEDLRDFLQRHRKTPLDGIVEQVRDGSTFRVLLLDNMQMITLSLGGIKAPAYRKDVPGVEDLIEPFGEEVCVSCFAHLMYYPCGEYRLNSLLRVDYCSAKFVWLWKPSNRMDPGSWELFYIQLETFLKLCWLMDWPKSLTGR